MTKNIGKDSKEGVIHTERKNEVKKEYLNKFRESKEALKRIEDQIREVEMHEISSQIGSINSVIHGSSTRKDLSDYIAKKDELVGKMIQERNRRIGTYTDIFQAIENVPDERERLVLTLRYIKCLKWEEIAVKMHVEWAQVHRIHAKALKHLNISKEKS